MMEYVTKVDERTILPLKQLVVSMFSEVQRKRSARTEEAEKANKHFPWLTSLTRANGFERRRGKR